MQAAPRGHLHVLGIAGTFMGGLALLAQSRGWHVSGSDVGIYPPMSTQLAASGIELCNGYDPAHLRSIPDCVVIGNALSRGNPAVEHVLNQGLCYTSGPQWLAENVLVDRWVLAVAGTHGKTTVSSMLAWILHHAGLDPGFLIGGVPRNFGISARLGSGRFFVVEADEYDTSFFDKRSKFVHYRPRTLVLNNLEFDHADIFEDLEAIQRQFHHLVRTVPGNGLVILPAGDRNLADVLQRGCWTPTERLALHPAAEVGWYARTRGADGQRFDVYNEGRLAGTVRWQLSGGHNVANGLAALAAAHHVGVAPARAVAALSTFAGVRRRMELRGTARGVRLYDDFAHHPTAIAATLDALRASQPRGRILAIVEPRSNTMRLGAHGDTLAAALDAADVTYFYRPQDLRWDPAKVLARLGARLRVHAQIESIVSVVTREAPDGDRIVVMSNGSFDGIHARLLRALEGDVPTP